MKFTFSYFNFNKISKDLKEIKFQLLAIASCKGTQQSDIVAFCVHCKASKRQFVKNKIGLSQHDFDESIGVRMQPNGCRLLW